MLLCQAGVKLFKGTVSRDFRTTVFSPSNPPWFTGYHPKKKFRIWLRQGIREHVSIFVMLYLSEYKSIFETASVRAP
jgi:hypothetical protein